MDMDEIFKQFFGGGDPFGGSGFGGGGNQHFQFNFGGGSSGGRRKKQRGPDMNYDYYDHNDQPP